MEDHHQWVWFDLDDTLHDFSSASAYATERTLDFVHRFTGIEVEQIKIGYNHVLKAHNELMFSDGRVSHDYRRERIIGAIGKLYENSPEQQQELISGSLKTYESALLNSLKLKDGCIDLCLSIKNRGVNMAIISDAPQDAQLRVIDRLGIGHFFEDIFTSGRMKKSKSNGMLFDVLETLQIKASDVTMIGDSIKRDINPAIKAGINAVWFNECANSSEECPTAQVHTLQDIIGII